MPNTLIPIQTYTLSSTTASVTFSNIPQNYTDLRLELSMRSTGNLGSPNTYFDVTTVSFNGSTSISQQQLYGNGASVFAGTGSSLQIHCVGSGATSNIFGNAVLHIPNYTSSGNKVVSVDLITENNATNALNMAVAGTWSTSSAITSIGLTPLSGSFVSGSTFTLYGISNGVKATGGTLTVAGGYAYHTFTSTGSFLPSQQIKGAEIILVAGGGSGASVGGSAETGGGGGAGGLRGLTSLTFNAGTSYTAVVGAGGSPGANGTNSMFIGYSATGGGAGGGSAGGSGGGGLSQNGSQRFGGAGNAGNYNPVEGYAGGNGNSSASSFAGGGGGAGAVGANGVSGQSGAGGIGSSTYTTWHAITGTGVLSGGVYYVAGGGGGGSASGVSAGGGGAGGGSAGGSAGTANTGGGGGGSPSSGGGGTSGGSGLIIVRYPIT